MPIAKCPRCKKLFTKESVAVCQDCQFAEEEDREKVRAVLEKDPNLNATAVAKRANVDVGVVTRMLDTGMLSTEVQASGKAICGQCGKPAISSTKRLCQPCLDKLNLDIAIAQRDMTMTKKDVEPLEPPPTVQQVLDTKRKKI